MIKLICFMEYNVNIEPGMLESPSPSPPMNKLALAIRHVGDIAAVAAFREEGFLEQKADGYLRHVAKEDPELLGDILFEMMCSDIAELNELAADHVGGLYEVDPSSGRALWELLIENRNTHSAAKELLYLYVSDDNSLTPQQIEDYAEMMRHANAYRRHAD